MLSRDPLVLCFPLLNFTLQDFPNTQGSQNFSFSTLSPPSRFCFPNSTRPLSLTWPNLMCQISVFDKGFVDATFVKPLTTSASRVYKPCFFTPLKTSFEPFMTLRILFSPWKTYPFLSNSPRESRFLFKSGTYLTSVNNLIDSSWSLNLTDPIPAILQALLFPSNTDPPSLSHNSSNKFLFGVMCQVQPESIIHSLLESLLETTRTSDDSKSS